MKRHIYRVTSFSIVGPYMLKVAFDDRTSQTIDFRPVLKGDVFAPLNDLAFFNRVRLDPEIDTLIWPNGADFDPATLHDWPEYNAELLTLSERWAEAREKRGLKIPNAVAVAEERSDYGNNKGNP